jgi:hypothetical protein
MKECIDEGTLQAYFDGELGRERAAAVAAHLASCLTCAQDARVVENESLLLSEALEPEFAESIPTERLRYQIEAAIATSPIARPVKSGASSKHSWLRSLRDLFFPSPQRVFGYAVLAAIIILSTILGAIYLQRGKVGPVAQNEPAKPLTNPGRSPEVVSPGPGTNQPPKPNGSVEAPKKFVPRKSPGRNAATAGVLPGERNYMTTIATLNATLKSDRPMRPSLQVEYEHNLALLDQAIEMTRDAARKNPKDPQAAQFMFAAYQSKVDLLNQVADARRFNTRD